MRPSKAHFVTSCQQLLALGVVLAVLTPAASVVSLDVIRTPGSGTPAAAPGEREETARHDGRPGAPRTGPDARAESTVPAAPVDAVVTEVALTHEDADEEDVPEDTEELTRTRLLSEPQPVTGYGAVGVTWSHDAQVEDDQIELQVRTSTDGTWTGWDELEYHDEHAPDPGEEAAGTRPGTDPLFVGEVDRVQLRAIAPGGLPDDMSLAVVAPGRPEAVTKQGPAVAAEDHEVAAPADGEDALELQAASTSAPRPKIYTRAQWGANERLRDGRPSYGSIRAAFVHHTVNANDYSRAQVPGMLRSIYAYHTQSRGWSDIGYNFLVDKFGRIWEGRYGGVARPVVGAHTLGYNDDSFAMSAIGNYETARPSQAMLKAYGALFAWKLGRAGIDPTDRSQNVSGTTFKAINGHRDAGSTACPGRYLYQKLPAIRTYAKQASQQGPEPVTLEQVDSDLASTPHPDLVVRRESDGRGMILPTGGLSGFRPPVTLVKSGWGKRAFLASPDLTGDGKVDLVTFDATGALEIRPGPATDGYRKVARTARGFRGHGLVTPAGDLDADGRVDFVGRSRGTLVTFLRTPRGGFRKLGLGTRVRSYVQLAAAGDVTGDGRPDLWGRDGSGRLWLHRGKGNGRFAARVEVSTPYADMTQLVGGVDWNGDRVADLLVRRANGNLLVQPGRGDGTLGRAVGPLADTDSLTMLSGAGQVTGKAAPDLLAAGPGGALVVVPHRGTFDLGRPLDTGRSFSRGDLLLHAGDFDGDGHGDVILRRKVGSLWLYRGRGTGRLAAPVWIGGKRPFAKVTGLRVVADVTGDKRNDLVGRLDGSMLVWPGGGADRLQKRKPIEVAAAVAGPDTSAFDWRINTSDLRRRGPADLVVRDGDGYLYRIDGTRKGYAAPRYLGEAGGYDLAG